MKYLLLINFVYVFFINNQAYSLEKSSGLPQLDFSTYPSLIFWSILSLIILYFLILKMVSPKISYVLNSREQSIHKDLMKAKTLKDEADTVNEKIKFDLENAKIKSRELLDEATQKGKALIEKEVNDASKRLNKKIVNSLKEITDVKKSQSTEIFKNTPLLSTMIISKILDLKVNNKELIKISSQVLKEKTIVN